jgi:hypothetical protein
MASRLGKLLLAFRPTNLLAAVILAALGYGGYRVYSYHRRAERVRRERQELAHTVGRLEAQNEALRQDVRSLEAQCAELEAFVERLTSESRVADVTVLSQQPDAAGVPVTTLRFVERARGGERLPPRTVAVRGREVYFDALLIKFADDHVKVGDPLRGKSLHLFRRAFGSAQEPRDGPFLAASESVVPDVYRLSERASEFERALWLRFWHWAAHPEEAEAEGVRIAQIEAVAIRPVLGTTYRITLEHDGGLNIRPLTQP